MSAEVSPSAGAVLLFAEGVRRGFKTSRAFRSWCKTNGVTIAKTGRKEWVRPADVDAALKAFFEPVAAALASRNSPDNAAANNVSNALARFTRKAV